jgi:hypothetical protein
MLQIVCWVSGTRFRDPAVNEVRYGATFERRNRVQRCIAARTKSETIYSSALSSASLLRR